MHPSLILGLMVAHGMRRWTLMAFECDEEKRKMNTSSYHIDKNLSLLWYLSDFYGNGGGSGWFTVNSKSCRTWLRRKGARSQLEPCLFAFTLLIHIQIRANYWIQLTFFISFSEKLYKNTRNGRPGWRWKQAKCCSFLWCCFRVIITAWFNQLIQLYCNLLTNWI